MRRRAIALLILLPVVLAATVIGHILLTSRTSPTTVDELRTRLHRLVPALMRKHEVPGVAVALVREGEVAWAEGYGAADKGKRTPVTENTVFQAASISKSVTAWGVMRLVEQGQIDLDTPVSTYLSRWHLPPSPFDANRVTVRRLLSHTAGLSVGGYLGYAPETSLPPLETELRVGADAAERPGLVRLAYPPGEQVHYSGGGYTVLQLVVEELSNQSFPSYMQQHVLAPLGMGRSSFESSPATEPDVATPYGSAGAVLPHYRFTAKAAGGLYTTAPDLARFVAAAMDEPSGAPRGRGVLAPTTLDKMLSPAPNATIDVGPIPVAAYGLGYHIHPVLLPGGGRVVGHDGSNQGWKATFLALTAEGEGIVILTNSENGRGLHEEATCRWAAWVTGSIIPLCLRTHLPQDALIAGGIWLVLALILLLRPNPDSSSRRQLGPRPRAATPTPSPARHQEGPGGVGIEPRR